MPISLRRFCVNEFTHTPNNVHMLRTHNNVRWIVQDTLGVYCKTDARSKTKFWETVRNCSTSLRCCRLDWWPKCFKVPPAPGGLTWSVVKLKCQFRSSCTAANKRIWASMLHLAKIWEDTPQSLKIGSRLGEFPASNCLRHSFNSEITFVNLDWRSLGTYFLTHALTLASDPDSGTCTEKKGVASLRL